jgi:hypothetical protein
MPCPYFAGNINRRKRRRLTGQGMPCPYFARQGIHINLFSIDMDALRAKSYGFGSLSDLKFQDCLISFYYTIEKKFYICIRF